MTPGIFSLRMRSAASSPSRNATSSYGSAAFPALARKRSRSTGTKLRSFSRTAAGSRISEGAMARRHPDCITAAATSSPPFFEKKISPRSSLSDAAATYWPCALLRCSSPCTIWTKYKRSKRSAATHMKTAERILARETIVGALDLIALRRGRACLCGRARRQVAGPMQIESVGDGRKAEARAVFGADVLGGGGIIAFEARYGAREARSLRERLFSRDDVQYRRADEINVGARERDDDSQKRAEQHRLDRMLGGEGKTPACGSKIELPLKDRGGVFAYFLYASSHKIEVGSWKLEVGSWKLEVGSWNLTSFNFFLSSNL